MYVIEDLNVEKVFGLFLTNETEFRIGNVIKKSCDKLYVKSKGYGYSFDSWIDKKRYRYIKLVISQNHIPIVKAK